MSDKNHENEIAALESLCTQGVANADDLIRLGNLHSISTRNLRRAIELYQRSIRLRPAAVPLYNMGLAFNDPDISQDLDAADAYRRALLVQATYSPAQQKLEETSRNLGPLAVKARAEATGLVSADNCYQFYVNPIALLGLADSFADDPDSTKTVQRATKRLLHEIELADGTIEWVPDLVIDRAKAWALANELDDPNCRRFHAIIFRNESLHRFLTHGDIEHFVYSDTALPEETLDAIHADPPEFIRFLSKPFAQQYNFVLSRAIEQRHLAVVEVLFDGRRWVLDEDQDICFRGAMQRVRALVEEVERRTRNAEGTKPDLLTFEKWLTDTCAVAIFNLLPTGFFRDEQLRVVANIREMAIDFWNEHSDSEQSAAALKLCRRFRFKSTELNKQLDEDSAVVLRILNDIRQYSFSASVRRGVSACITFAGIQCGEIKLAPEEIECIRWGEYVHTVNGIESEHNFGIVARGQGRCVEIAWGKRSFFRKMRNMFGERVKAKPIDELRTGDQQLMFLNAVNAALHFLVPALLQKIVERLRNDGSLTIGPCRLSRTGITFRTGVVSHKDRFVPWSSASARLLGGQVEVANERDSRARTAMPLMQTDNAALLPKLVEMMRRDGQETTVESSEHRATPAVASKALPASGRAPRVVLFSIIGIGVVGLIAIAISGSHSQPKVSVAPRAGRTAAAEPDTTWPRPVAPRAGRTAGTQPSSSVPAVPPRIASSDRETISVQSSRSAELRRDRQIIEEAKFKATQLESALASLAGQLDRERLSLDRTSGLEVARFNQGNSSAVCVRLLGKRRHLAGLDVGS